MSFLSELQELRLAHIFSKSSSMGLSGTSVSAEQIRVFSRRYVTKKVSRLVISEKIPLSPDMLETLTLTFPAVRAVHLKCDWSSHSGALEKVILFCFHFALHSAALLPRFHVPDV